MYSLSPYIFLAKNDYVYCKTIPTAMQKKKDSSYKALFFSLPKPLTPNDLRAIEILNQSFQPKYFYVQVENNSIRVNLNQVDISKLKNIKKRLKNSVIDRIVGEIGRIGSYAIKGNKRIYIDYNREQKVKNRKEKEKKRTKYFYAENDHFTRDVEKLPLNYVNKIICGDSDHILKKLPDNCIDLILTSPPYNFGLSYIGHDDQDFWGLYFQKLFSIFRESIRILKYGGRLVINVQPLFSDYIPTHHIISNYFMQQKLIWKGEILWEKHNYNCKYTAWGSWKSPSNPYLKYTWEFLEIFCKGDLRKTGQSNKIDIDENEFKKWVFAKWDIAPEKGMKHYRHPAVFPEELVRRVLKLFSYQNDIILDPFNGVGTTTFMAKKLRRQFLGIDISEKYCEIARERLDILRIR